MAWQLSIIVAVFTFDLLHFSPVLAAGSMRDWQLVTEQAGTEAEKKLALTATRPPSGSGPKPKLVIRRAQSNQEIDLLIIDTHDTNRDSCDYQNWQVMIDTTEVPVLGYTFNPAQTELKAKLGTSREALWNSFRNGLQFSVMVEQKCDSFGGEIKPVTYRFSLRGSNAAYQFLALENE